MKKAIIFSIAMLFGLAAEAQVFTLKLDQPDILVIDPGNDTLLCKTHSVILGGESTASGGSGDYFYSWYPNIYLDNHTLSNPTCTPEETTTYMLTVNDINGCSTSSFVTVAVDPCLGINNIVDKNSISVFPNPVNDHFTISGLPSGIQVVKVKILNQLGQKVHEEDVYSNSNETITINKLVDLKPGIYLLQLNFGDYSTVQTIHFL